MDDLSDSEEVPNETRRVLRRVAALVEGYGYPSQGEDFLVLQKAPRPACVNGLRSSLTSAKQTHNTFCIANSRLRSGLSPS